MFLALLMLIAFSTMVSCEKKSEPDFYTAADIPELSSVQGDGTLYFEWMRSYDSDKPLMVVFHGEENAENVFTTGLSKKVYTGDVMVSTAGYNSRIYLDKSGENYDMEYFLCNVGQFNVVVFHWERFADEVDTESVVAKIFSTYKSRYKVNGEYKSAFSIPLADVVAALYMQEMERINVGSKEIRFVGAGAGALLAEAVAAKVVSIGKKEIYPYRISMCDAPLSEEFVTFDTEWLSCVSSSGTIGLVSEMSRIASEAGIVLDMYESKETDGTSIKYAYDYKKARGESFTDLKKYFAYLEIAESYTKLPLFDNYKNKKRIAFDWYIYSIIGSDDPAVGTGSISNVQDLSLNNRGSNDTRPILNERLITNAEPDKRGRNFGLSAWTPTVYVRGLRGISFYQRTAGLQNGTDIHGREKYVYKQEYVLDKFSSENYQVSDMRDYTVLCGYVYYDRNENDYIDDGIKEGYDGGQMTLGLSYSSETEDVVVFSKQIITTDQNGFFTVRLEDADSLTDSILITKNEKGLCVISGVCCADRTLTATLSFKYPTGITSYFGTSVDGLYYTTLSGNNFSHNEYRFYVTAHTVHGLLIANCLYVDFK